MTWRKLAAVASAAALIGCSDAAGPAGTRELQVTVLVENGTGTTAGSLAGSPAANLAVTVDIESAVFVLGGLKLETAGLDSTMDWIFDESVVVPLDFTGAPTLAFDTDVTPGVYKELELSVDKLEPGNPAEDLLIADWPDLADASVLVTGIVSMDGGPPTSFTFTAALDIDLELLFDSPVTFTAEADGVILVALAIDPSGWFTGPSGTLDPTEPANRSAIEGNIQASVELRQDQ